MKSLGHDRRHSDVEEDLEEEESKFSRFQLVLHQAVPWAVHYSTYLFAHIHAIYHKKL